MRHPSLDGARLTAERKRSISQSPQSRGSRGSLRPIVDGDSFDANPMRVEEVREGMKGHQLMAKCLLTGHIDGT